MSDLVSLIQNNIEESPLYNWAVGNVPKEVEPKDDDADVVTKREVADLASAVVLSVQEWIKQTLEETVEERIDIIVEKHGRLDNETMDDADQVLLDAIRDQNK